MNILQFLKNGSGIHIKKENRGKFTDYCGGKVTSECIAKGKRSSNPAIRKRATFAANARKWKHEDGGRVKKHQAFVNGVSILDSNPDAYKYVKKKLHKAATGGTTGNWTSKIGNVMNSGVGQALSGITSNLLNQGLQIKGQNDNLEATGEQAIANEKQALSQELSKINQLANYVTEQRRLQWQQDYLNGNTLDRSFESDAVQGALKNQIEAPLKASAIQNFKDYKKQIKNSISKQKQANWTNFAMNGIGQVGNGILGMIGNKPSNNTSTDTSSVSPTNTASTPTYQPSYKYDMMAPYKKDFTFKI